MNDDLALKDQIVRIDKTIAETQKLQSETAAIKMRTFPAWIFAAALVGAVFVGSDLALEIFRWLSRG